MNPKATIALIVAAVGLCILGTAGAIVGGLAVVRDYESDHPEASAVAPQPETREGYFAFEDVLVGECALEDGSDAWGFEIVDCAKDHDFEIFASFDLPDGPWPGEATVDRRTEQECDAKWAEYFGAAYVDGEYGYWTSTDELWPEYRLSVCYIEADGPGALRGTGLT